MSRAREIAIRTTVGAAIMSAMWIPIAYVLDLYSVYGPWGALCIPIIAIVLVSIWAAKRVVEAGGNISDVLRSKPQVHRYKTIAFTVIVLAISIAIAVIAYMMNILSNPMAVAGISAILTLSTASIILMIRYINYINRGITPYTKFIWFLNYLILTVILITLPATIPSTQPIHKGAWILGILLPTSLAISIAVEEAPNWIYLLRKSK